MTAAPAHVMTSATQMRHLNRGARHPTGLSDAVSTLADVAPTTRCVSAWAELVLLLFCSFALETPRNCHAVSHAHVKDMAAEDSTLRQWIYVTSRYSRVQVMDLLPRLDPRSDLSLKPSLTQLAAMAASDPSSLASVSNFTISRPGIGSVCWLEEVPSPDKPHITWQLGVGAFSRL